MNSFIQVFEGWDIYKEFQRLQGVFYKLPPHPTSPFLYIFVPIVVHQNVPTLASLNADPEKYHLGTRD